MAIIIGRSRSTVQRWLSQYRSGGLEKMLEVGKSPGKEPLIPQWAVERLKAELSEPEGFISYKEVNPIERLWKEIKKSLKWEWFTNLDELRLGVQKVLQNLTETIITSVIGYKFIIDALVMAGI